MERSVRGAAAIPGQETGSPHTTPESVALTAGGIAALLAGACCLAPLVLVSVGLGGAWLANLQSLEPLRPLFVAVALAALSFAGWRLYRPIPRCEAGTVCARPGARRALRIAFWVVGALLVVMLGVPYFAPLFY